MRVTASKLRENVYRILDEAISTGVTVGLLTAVDGDANDTHTFSLIGDSSSVGFTIVGNELRVADASKLDFETAPTVSVTVRAEDSTGNRFDKSFDFAVRNVVEGYSIDKVGGEFLVNTQTASSQYGPTITGLATGGFVVSWYDNGTGGDASGSNIKAQVFDAGGTKVGGEFLINTHVLSLGENALKLRLPSAIKACLPKTQLR